MTTALPPARLGISETVSEMERRGGRPRWGKWARISGQPQSAVERRCNEISQGSNPWASASLDSSLLEAGQSCATGKTTWIPKGLPFGAGLGWREARKKCPRSVRFAGGDVCCGQSSSGMMIVMAGCGSSMSSGPQVAISLTSAGRGCRCGHRTQPGCAARRGGRG